MVKKITALAVAFILMLSLAACGGKGEDVTGKYEIVSASFTDSGDAAETNGEWIELKKGGKGTFYSGNEGYEYELEWKLDGKDFTGPVTFLGLENSCCGTLTGGVLTVKYGDYTYIIAKEGSSPDAGGSAPAPAAPASYTDTSVAASIFDAFSGYSSPGGEDPVPDESAADQLFWAGDWYGWWLVTGGEYTGWDDGAHWWDCCAEIDLDDSGEGTFILWDAYGDRGDLMINADVCVVSEGDAAGYLKTLSGTFYDYEISDSEWLIAPDSTVYEKMVSISGRYIDPYNSSNYIDYTIIMRPWGMDWEDTESSNRPAFYSDWYLPAIESDSPMPDKISG